MGPNTTKGIHFGKLETTTGGNRGRGQVYPTGDMSNNNVFQAPAAGTITAIEAGEKGVQKVTVKKADGTEKSINVLAGATMVVNVGDTVKKDQALTTNPNVGGFGQQD